MGKGAIPLPADYGLPAAEIEVDWRAYLLNNYGIEFSDY